MSTQPQVNPPVSPALERASLIVRGAGVLLKHALVKPFTDFQRSKDLLSTVLEFDFQRRKDGKLPSSNIHSVIPEIGDVEVTLIGRSWGPEAPFLCSAARALRARKILEIGTFEGVTTLQLAANVEPGGTVYTVDLQEDQDTLAYMPAYDKEMSVRGRRVFVPDEECGQRYRERIVRIFGDSAQVDYARHFDALDLAYVDGGHGYDQVRLDTERVLPLVRPGGAVFWHDYQPSCTGVKRYLDELGALLPVVHVRNTQLAVLRIPEGGLHRPALLP